MTSFMKFYDEIEDVPYPGNDFGFWDVFIGTHPIDWKPQVSNKTYYPILLRYHHSLFDGYHLMTTIFGNFSDAKMTLHDVQKFDTNIIKKCFEKTYVLFRQLYETCTFPWRYFLIANENNFSILCKSKLQNKKIFSYRCEENPRYIQLIKEIKRQVHGISFTDVILAALSSSLSQYIIKNSTTIPNHITVSTPEVPKAKDLLNTAMQGDEASLTCKNKVHFSLRSLPVDEHMDMKQRLNLLKDQGGFLKSPYQIMVDYYVMTFISSTFPDMILKKIFNCMRNSAIVTNLPGPPKTTCLSGHPLEMMIMHSISKSSTNTGISCLFSTYDGRLQTTLTADRAVISSKREMDDIILNIYKSLDELYDQVCANNNSTN
ncbi:hypothetical protein FQR65_LT10413 [Abscondita terminalis]|nr:hypothetical protein FQR65_LT10413 [Abscondita terminalis]